MLYGCHSLIRGFDCGPDSAAHDSDFLTQTQLRRCLMKESILNGKWVLGVNDDPDVLKRLEEKIKKAAPSCHFEKSTTYKDAFEHLVFFMYDLLILDNTLPRNRELLDFAVNRPFPVPVAIVTSIPVTPDELKLTKESGAKVVLPAKSTDGIVPVLEYIVWHESLSPLARFFENIRQFVNARSASTHTRDVPDSDFSSRMFKRTYRANIFTGWKQPFQNLKNHLNGYFESSPKCINRKWPEWRCFSDINGASEVKI